MVSSGGISIFYGWAREDEKGFEAWFIMDILKYKLLIQESGGIDKIGTLHRNYTHGRSSFYSIPMDAISPAIIRRSDPIMINMDEFL